MSPRAAAVFYLGVPLLSGQILGWNRTGIGQWLGVWESVLYWTLFALAIWWCAVVGTRIAHVVLARWAPAQWIVMLAGVVIGALVAEPLVAWLTGWGWSMVPPDLARRPRVEIGPSWEFAALVFRQMLPGTLLWLGVNMVYDRLLGIPRYRYGEIAPQPPSGSPSGTPPTQEAEESFLARVPEHLRAPLLAISAEDHYVRVHTERGACLVYCRFADALEQLRNVPGLQVHRSHWIKRPAARKLLVEGHSHKVVLQGGLRIPVSRSYLRDLRQVLGGAAGS